MLGLEMALAFIISFVSFHHLVVPHTELGPFGLHHCLRLTGVCLCTLFVPSALVYICFVRPRSVAVALNHRFAQNRNKQRRRAQLLRTLGWLVIAGVVVGAVCLRRSSVSLADTMWWIGAIGAMAPAVAPVVGLIYLVLGIKPLDPPK